MFQSRYRSMDKFLACLAKALTESSKAIIVDVGANVGDTAVLLAQYTNARILAIEGSERYYRYLVQNIQGAALETQILTEFAIVGTGSLSGTLHERNGTASLKISDSAPQVALKSLDSIVEQRVGRDAEIVLIKVDVDGSDFDCLLSGREVIRSQKPLLFFENDVRADNVGCFDRLYPLLSAEGYSHWYVFDNFGNYMFSTHEWQAVTDCNRYVLSQDHWRLKRTVHYVDVLACTDDQADLAKRSIAAYRQFLQGDLEFPNCRDL